MLTCTLVLLLLRTHLTIATTETLQQACTCENSQYTLL